VRIVGKDVRTNEPTAVTVDEAAGKISSVGPLDKAKPDDLGAPDLWLAPAFFDIQANGSLGLNLSSPHLKPEDVAKVAAELARHGVALWLPTVVTCSRETALHALRTIAAACDVDRELSDSVVGLHIEGFYISPEDGPRGAHHKAHVRPPDWEEFELFREASGGRIRHVSIAPEVAGAMEFIKRAVEAEIVVGIVHHMADDETIRRAIDHGARIATHLGNGCHFQLPRHRNYIWTQLAEDRLWASLIADGHHLAPAIFKSFVRTKSVERTVLVSDVAAFGGLPAGVYEYWDGSRKVEVHASGLITLHGSESLAGSALHLDTGVATASLLAEVPLADSVRMATTNPARLMGVTSRIGEVVEGREANLVCFAWDGKMSKVDVRVTVRKGKAAFQK